MTSSRRINSLAFLVVLLAFFARLLPGPRTIDDSYITFRYARNLLAGEGFSFNPGERVLGTTTPLYTTLMAALGFATGGIDAPFPLLALLVNAIADSITCLLLLFAGRRLALPWAGFGAALAWAVAPWSVTFAIGGLETSLYVLLLTGVALAYAGRRLRLTAVLAAFSLLTRPDALLLLVPLGIDWLWRELWQSRQNLNLRRVLLEPAALFLLIYTPWLVFSSFYFGSPLPHSITAKAVAYRLAPQEGFIRLLQHYATPFMGDNLTGPLVAVGLGLVIFPFLYLVGARRIFRSAPRLLPWLVFPWFYFAVYALANPLIFRWYLTPPLTPYFFCIFAGIEVLLLAFVQRKQPAGSLALLGWKSTFLFVLPSLLLLTNWVLRPDHGLTRPAPRMAWVQLELLYRQAALELLPAIAAHPSTPTLAAGDVGVLGFFSGAKILDTVGLNSPETTAYYPLDARYYIINYAIAPDLILDRQPDFLVFLEVYGRAGLLRDDRFLSAYTLRKKIPTAIYGSDGLLIFEKK